MAKIKVHGVTFIRKGTCVPCEGCAAKCRLCPHGLDNGYKCSVYKKRDEVCDECTNNPDSIWYDNGNPVTHKICIDFPGHPWSNVIKEGVCSYSFTPSTKKDAAKEKELNKVWQ